MKICSLILALSSLFLIISCEKNPAEIESNQYSWKFSTPAEQGMDPARLDSAYNQAQLEGFIDGLLIIRNGCIVSEKYYNGYGVNTPHNVMSVSKSFLSAVTGLALQQGYIDSLNERMLDYFPEYVYPGIDERKYQITIRHLLTMRMGIEDETENYFEIYNSDNWIKTIIEWPLLYPPGERMRYNTFQTHLLSAILTRASQMSTLELARKVLTNPMGISIDAWEQDPQGYYFGGNSMFFTPREMAVLGYMYLNGGRLNDVQIVPQEWVEFTLTSSTNSPPNAWGAFKNYNYAYLWWLGQIYQYDLFLAYGHGGQFIACFPDLNVIVVSTANNQVDYDTATLQEWAIFDIMDKYILPSVLD